MFGSPELDHNRGRTKGASGNRWMATFWATMEPERETHRLQSMHYLTVDDRRLMEVDDGDAVYESWPEERRRRLLSLCRWRRQIRSSVFGLDILWTSAMLACFCSHASPQDLNLRVSSSLNLHPSASSHAVPQYDRALVRGCSARTTSVSDH